MLTAYLDFPRRSLACAVAALLAVAPSGGHAQRTPPPPTVSELVVTPLPMVPVPNVGEGAPLYSAPEIAAIETEARMDVMGGAKDLQGCEKVLPMGVRPQITGLEADSIGRAAARNGGEILLPPAREYGGVYGLEYAAAKLVRDSAMAAQAATRAAEQVRRDAAQGRATTKAVEDGELARQAAVTRMTTALAIHAEVRAQTAEFQYAERTQTLVARDPTRRYMAGVAAPPLGSPYASLGLENIAAKAGSDRDGAFLLVSGHIRNTQSKPINVPPLSVTAVDATGFPLKTEIAQASGRPGRIAPGEAKAFAYRFRPSPRHADNIIVTFGSNKYVPWRLPQGLECGPSTRP